MTPRLRDDLTPVVAEALAAFSVGFFVVCVVLALLLAGCVTRTTVCVETAHGVGRRDDYGARPSSAGASVCVDVERP